MSSPLPTLLRALKALVLCLSLLGLLVQPVFAAAHDLHEAEHASLDLGSGDGSHEPSGDASSPMKDTLDRLLHAFDCCMHVTAMPAGSYFVAAIDFKDIPAGPRALRLPMAPLTRAMRPPIVA
jgi:hypothetical protein